MKNTFLFIFLVSSLTTLSQERVNPIIKSFGGIYEISEATVIADPDLAYNIVIDIYGGPDSPEKVDASLNNVARLLNLHAVSGADMERMKVVLAIHGKSTYSTMSDEAYNDKFGFNNPNTPLVKELKQAGVRLTVCGQSLKGRSVKNHQLLSEIEVATSMLTTVTTHQLKGYAVLKF